jgi:hypothetical protein
MNNRWRLFVGTLLCLQGLACAANVDDKSSEDTAAVENAVTVDGTYTGPYANGLVSSNPMSWRDSFGNDIVFCEGSYMGISAGKLWNGQCRFEYGDTLHYTTSYWVLDRPSNFAWVRNPGHVPNNAIMSSNPLVPVCVGYGPGTVAGPGKYWLGTCRFEYGDTLWESPNFDFLVATP